MKKRQFLTVATAILMSLGVVSCASDEEKMQEQQQERQEEIQEAEQERQKMEEKAREAQYEADQLRQEQMEAEQEMAHSDKPWADQQVSRDKVTEVQDKLKEKGFDVGQSDGLIGPKTSEGLKNFQEANNISASGELNQETIDALGLDIDLSESFAE